MSSKKNTWSKRLKRKLAAILLLAYVRGLARYQRWQVTNQAQFEEITAAGTIIPCYWHRHNLGCAMYLLRQDSAQFQPGFLVSPSNDGAIASDLLSKFGGNIIRGSATRTGAQAIRDLYRIMQQNISPAHTPDGPRGPCYAAKPGVIMLAQMTQRPILPIACSSTRYWQFNSWDKFILPKWFGTTYIVIGEPFFVEPKLPLDKLATATSELDKRLLAITEQAEQLAKQSA